MKCGFQGLLFKLGRVYTRGSVAEGARLHVPFRRTARLISLRSVVQLHSGPLLGVCSRSITGYGAVAQLGEHLLCKQGVRGSSPRRSTTLGRGIPKWKPRLVRVREQSQELYGFSSLAAKKMFELLITVQGVGPKAALAILSLGESETVRNAIANSDAVFIAKASGVGKKTAERVVVDLSDKVGLALRYDNSVLTGTSQPISHTDEALEALMALGYNLNDATNALEGIPTDLSTADRVTQALKG